MKVLPLVIACGLLGGVGQADLATAYEHGAMGVAGIRLLVDKG